VAAANITPAYDHIVVVIEENHSLNGIIGNAQAPYLNLLAHGGALLTNFHAVAHPSQPNYFALYAGTTFGISDNGIYKLPGPTLATVLQDAGKTFAGYMEPPGLWAVNPWVSFAEGKSVERDVDTIPQSGNFSALPDVSFVVPDLDDDMHDGSVATADQWLKDNLGGYAQWAATHHSLLVVTWDEDDYSANNLIPTILFGANINPGTYDASYTHYDLLSMLAGASALTAPNNGALAAGLGNGIFSVSTSHWIASVDAGVHPAGWMPTAFGDFNHDGTSDVFWFNSTTGGAEVWLLSNGTWSASVDIGSHPAGWQPAGVGDFNHDGTSDVLWFNATTNDSEIWEIVNGHWDASVDLGSHPAGWRPAGVGDFNHDSTSDVLWYNPANGDTEVWTISNAQWAGSNDLGAHPPGWQPAGVGDFNHDGTSDVLWYNPATHDAEISMMANDKWARSVDLGVHPAGWQPAGIGDFNHDGTSDVLWFNATTNDAEIWEIMNGHWAASVDLGSHPAGWTVSGVGDFNHDGNSDILWRETATGRIEEWLIGSN
jgi:hypothetical protein